MEERAPASKLEPLGLIFAGAGVGVVLCLIALVVAFVVFLMLVVGSGLGPN